ncbi:hypothetical protein E8F12_02755 [Pseudomonas sp. BN102]|nr:hypothetical protein [Pseudomonas sp. BN102]
MLILSLACLGSPAALAQAQLRAHWVQEIQDQPALVGVLSRGEGEDVRYVDLYVEVFSSGMSLGTEVRRVEVDETVALFSLPVAEGVDCYEVDAVIGLDRDGQEMSGDVSSPVEEQRCSASGLHYFETALHTLAI